MGARAKRVPVRANEAHAWPSGMYPIGTRIARAVMTPIVALAPRRPALRAVSSIAAEPQVVHQRGRLGLLVVLCGCIASFFAGAAFINGPLGRVREIDVTAHVLHNVTMVAATAARRALRL